jgi:hypothetical protein
MKFTKIALLVIVAALSIGSVACDNEPTTKTNPQATCKVTQGKQKAACTARQSQLQEAIQASN